jgi:hypothetical protein
VSTFHRLQFARRNLKRAFTPKKLCAQAQARMEQTPSSASMRNGWTASGKVQQDHGVKRRKAKRFPEAILTKSRSRREQHSKRGHFSAAVCTNQTLITPAASQSLTHTTSCASEAHRRIKKQLGQNRSESHPNAPQNLPDPVRKEVVQKVLLRQRRRRVAPQRIFHLLEHVAAGRKNDKPRVDVGLGLRASVGERPGRARGVHLQTRLKIGFTYLSLRPHFVSPADLL